MSQKEDLHEPEVFARADEVELAWSLIDPIQQTWDTHDRPELLFYEPGQWGPAESAQWIARHGHGWFDACPVLDPAP